jgi:hypothetical protein
MLVDAAIDSAVQVNVGSTTTSDQSRSLVLKGPITPSGRRRGHGHITTFHGGW